MWVKIIAMRVPSIKLWRLFEPTIEEDGEGHLCPTNEYVPVECHVPVTTKRQCYLDTEKLWPSNSLWEGKKVVGGYLINI